MNNEQLKQLKAMVEEAGDLPEAAKVRLLEILGQQEAEVESSQPEGASEVQGKLLSSVEEFEAAHPEATSFMGRLATTLANMGI
ncbi:DUF4404 family protein [Prosthecobacter sp.]|uniref:DUF4404 family protein n=1 Tax=Prosthecobacter sp. TaxID=1965333 RepID=UPI003784C73C